MDNVRVKDLKQEYRRLTNFKAELRNEVRRINEQLREHDDWYNLEEHLLEDLAESLRRLSDKNQGKRTKILKIELKQISIREELGGVNIETLLDRKITTLRLIEIRQEQFQVVKTRLMWNDLAPEVREDLRLRKESLTDKLQEAEDEYWKLETAITRENQNYDW
jgi:chromosome segregation ATPase